jgi:hypothetical protein
MMSGRSFRSRDFSRNLDEGAPGEGGRKKNKRLTKVLGNLPIEKATTSRRSAAAGASFFRLDPSPSKKKKEKSSRSFYVPVRRNLVIKGRFT